jgi:hypothetical protein
LETVLEAATVQMLSSTVQMPTLKVRMASSTVQMTLMASVQEAKRVPRLFYEEAVERGCVSPREAVA